MADPKGAVEIVVQHQAQDIETSSDEHGHVPYKRKKSFAPSGGLRICFSVRDGRTPLTAALPCHLVQAGPQILSTQHGLVDISGACP